jgi:ribosomal-protein-alanine N-acetyltransferase
MYTEVFVPYPTIYTDRLIIRQVKRKDAEDLFELCHRPETSQYSLWRPHNNIEETRSLINYQLSLYRKHKSTFFVVELKETGRVIGTCSYVSIDENYKIAEIGYSILSDLWGKGYGTEVADALCGFAFDRMLVQRVYAHVLPENVASAKVLLHVGFEYEGTLKKGYFFDGKVSDVDVYGITDEMYFSEEE